MMASEKTLSHLPDDLVRIDDEAVMEVLAQEEKLRVTPDRKLWRTMNAYVQKGRTTYKNNSYSHDLFDLFFIFCSFSTDTKSLVRL